MKWFVYNLLFFVVYMAMTPMFLLRMKRRGGYRQRMGDRFGRYPAEISSRFGEGFVWIHAVSVGEVQVAGQLMRALRERSPSIRFVFSTTSSTGWKTAEREVTDRDILIYNPLDFNSCVRRALDQIRPVAVILTETEIWPNFIRAIRRRNLPLWLVNARVSDHSAPRYRRLRWFFGEVLRCFTKIFAQSELDAQRLIAAGADPQSIAVTGSFKFDVAHRNESKERELAAWISGSAPLPPILLGGSTWPGEDVALLGIYSQLVQKHPEVSLVIAPRHFEKADAVEANILAAGFPCVRRSRPTPNPTPQPSQPINQSSNHPLIQPSNQPLIQSTNRPINQSSNRPIIQSSNPPVFLCDTTGEMMGLFGISTVAFVGKSLCAHGSQNMIEPCLCGKPTVVGPYTENFRPVMSDLLSADALVQVQDEVGLRDAIFRFFDDPSLRVRQGERARAAVERRCGVVARCADELLATLRI